MPVVDVTNLSHAYGGRLALDGVSLSVEAGEVFGLLGPNGSGKTTLFRILSTLIPTTPGRATILGFDVARDRDAVRRRIGVVFQSPSLDKQLTAEENLVHQGHLYGLRGAELARRVAAALESVGLGDRAPERVGTFSGGMRRRVELAKGLLHRPPILLMDEPSTGIDPAARIDLWRQLHAISGGPAPGGGDTIGNRHGGGGVTVLLTTHLMEEAEHCTRLAVLAGGRLLACDTPGALKSRIGGDVITIATRDPDAVRSALREKLGVEGQVVGEVVRLERDRGHEFVPHVVQAAPGLIDSIAVGKPTLEDVFLHLTGRQFRSGEDTGSVAPARWQSRR